MAVRNRKSKPGLPGSSPLRMVASAPARLVGAQGARLGQPRGDFMPLYAGTFAAVLGWGAFLGAALDGVENIALYRMLATQEASAALGWIAGLCAALKLVMIAVALLGLPLIRLVRPTTPAANQA